MADTRDPYKILGIPTTASESDIKKAFRKLVVKWHPDVCHEPNAEERFKDINWAYHQLTEGSYSGTKVKEKVEVWVHTSLFKIQKVVKEL